MKFLSLLKKLARFSDHRQHKMSCIIAKGNKLVSMGFNQVKTCPRVNTNYNMLHAEVSALLGLDFSKTKGCTAYVFREHRDGNFAIAKPCAACEMALRAAGIKKVVYSGEGFIEEMAL